MTTYEPREGHAHLTLTFEGDFGHGYALAAMCDCGLDLYAMGSTRTTATKAIRTKWLDHIAKRVGDWQPDGE